MWNYFNTDKNRTNNACEAYNKTLYSYFISKPTIIKLINILSIEEDSLFKAYSTIAKKGFISKKRKIGPSDYISCLLILLIKKKN